MASETELLATALSLNDRRLTPLLDSLVSIEGVDVENNENGINVRIDPSAASEVTALLDQSEYPEKTEVVYRLLTLGRSRSDHSKKFDLAPDVISYLSLRFATNLTGLMARHGFRSYCGDGVVQIERGEQCELNSYRYDGCDETCQFTENSPWDPNSESRVVIDWAAYEAEKALIAAKDREQLNQSLVIGFIFFIIGIGIAATVGGQSDPGDSSTPLFPVDKTPIIPH